MTTIAYRDGIIAGDQRSTDGNDIMPGNFTKVRKNPKGWIYGCCGTSGPIIEFETFMEEFKPDKLPNKKAPRGDYRALVVDPDGNIYDIDKGLGEKIPANAPFYAIGSGQTAALGALYQGATAIEAVECAIKVDKSSGGGVDFIRLKETE